jgi:hypothetical protein
MSKNTTMTDSFMAFTFLASSIAQQQAEEASLYGQLKRQWRESIIRKQHMSTQTLGHEDAQALRAVANKIEERTTANCAAPEWRELTAADDTFVQKGDEVDLGNGRRGWRDVEEAMPAWVDKEQSGYPFSIKHFKGGNSSHWRIRRRVEHTQTAAGCGRPTSFDYVSIGVYRELEVCWRDACKRVESLEADAANNRKEVDELKTLLQKDRSSLYSARQTERKLQEELALLRGQLACQQSENRILEGDKQRLYNEVRTLEVKLQYAPKPEWRELVSPQDDKHIISYLDECFRIEEGKWGPARYTVGMRFGEVVEKLLPGARLVRTKRPRPVKVPEHYDGKYVNYSFSRPESRPGACDGMGTCGSIDLGTVFKEGVRAAGGKIA